jgi:hypothetical protein
VNERRAQTPVQTSAGEPAPRDAGLAGRAPTMRPPMKWFEIIVGVITAGSAAVALFFASRTVSQARAAAEEIRRDRAERRLERILELVANIRLANQDSNRVLSGTYQGQLKPLVVASERSLQKTYELSERTFTGDSYPADDALAKESLEELRAAFNALASD